MDKYRFRRFAKSFCAGFFFSWYERTLGFVSDEIDGSCFTYDFNTDIGRLLYFNGGFEEREIELCGRYIKRNSVVLDVGANIGIHSIFFHKMAEDGLVFSFEPSPETFGLLLKNVSGLKNIIPVNIGIYNSKDVLEFYIASDNAYSGLKDTKRKEIQKTAKVVCFSADDFFRGINLKNIDFVKIDVEGLEQNVLEGMERIIEKYRPVIFCEIYKGVNSNADPEKTVNYLIGKGYDVSVFDGNSLIKYKEHNDRYYNYLFLPRYRRQI